MVWAAPGARETLHEGGGRNPPTFLEYENANGPLSDTTAVRTWHKSVILGSGLFHNF
jgi:hypothetical protein